MPSVSADITMPFSASFDTAGTGTLETVKQQFFAWDASADATFTAPMSLTAFKNAFVLSQEEEGDSGAALEVAVTTDDGKITAFKNALTASLQLADMRSWLQDEANTAIQAFIGTNGVPAALEASAIVFGLTNFDQDLATADISTGAAAMWTAISGGSDNLRRLIALQLPKEKYPAEFSSELPLIGGESVLFRFHITQKYVSSIVESAVDLIGETDPAHTDGAAPTFIKGYELSKIVDLKVTLTA